MGKCYKYTLVNTGTTIQYFNYQKCDGQWVYQFPIEPQQRKNIWLVDNTYTSAIPNSSAAITSVRAQILPTPTPTPTNISQARFKDCCNPLILSRISQVPASVGLVIGRSYYLKLPKTSTYSGYTGCSQYYSSSAGAGTITTYSNSRITGSFSACTDCRTSNGISCNTPTPTPTRTPTPTPTSTPVPPTSTQTSTPTPTPTLGSAQLFLTFVNTGNTQSWFVQGVSAFTMSVNWGDGQTTSYNSSDNYQPTHIYNSAGTYTTSLTFSSPTVITNLDISSGYGNNRLRNILGLDSLTNLTSLSLGGNILTGFTTSGISSVLTTLDLSYNNLTSFSSDLPNSTTDLYLNNNSITSVTLTPTVSSSIVNLYLNNNSLTGFTAIYPLLNVKTLNLSNNLITSLNFAYPLPISIETLDLSNNLLTSFGPQTPFPNSISNILLNGNNIPTTGITNIFTYFSAVTNWVSPNYLSLINQISGGCLATTANTTYQAMMTSGWTIDVNVCPTSTPTPTPTRTPTPTPTSSPTPTPTMSGGTTPTPTATNS